MADHSREYQRSIEAEIESLIGQLGVLALDNYMPIYDINGYSTDHCLLPVSPPDSNEFAADLRQQHDICSHGDAGACGPLPTVLDDFIDSGDEDPSEREISRELSYITLPSLPSLSEVKTRDEHTEEKEETRQPGTNQRVSDSGYSTVQHVVNDVTAPKHSPPSSSLATPGEDAYQPRNALTDETHTSPTSEVTSQTTEKLPVEIIVSGQLDKRTLMVDAQLTRALLISEIYKQNMCPEPTGRYTETIIKVTDAKSQQSLRNSDVIGLNTRVEFQFR